MKGYCEKDTFVYLILELVNGHVLATILYQEYTNNLYDLMLLEKHSVCKQICLALHYSHTHEVRFIYCDVKPENILAFNSLSEF